MIYWVVGIVAYFLCIAIPFYFFGNEDNSKEEFHGFSSALNKLRKKENEKRLKKRKQMVEKANEDWSKVNLKNRFF